MKWLIALFAGLAISAQADEIVDLTFQVPTDLRPLTKAVHVYIGSTDGDKYTETIPVVLWPEDTCGLPLSYTIATGYYVFCVHPVGYDDEIINGKGTCQTRQVN